MDLGTNPTTVREPEPIKIHDRCPLCAGSLRNRYRDIWDRLGTSTSTYRLDECSQCGLGLINPAPTGDLGRFYPDRYLSQEEGEDSAGGIVSRLERSWRYDQYRFDFGLLERAAGLDLSVADSYVDIGCGSGERVMFASDRGVGRPVGIDRFAFGKQSPHRNAALVNTDIFEFRPEDRFQVASMFHVLEHVEDPVAVLRYVRQQILREDGLLVLQVPNYGSRERRLFGRRWFGLDAPRHLFQFNEKTLGLSVEAAGLEVVETYRTNAALHPVTVVPSLFPALDVQRIWVTPGTPSRRLLLQLLWAVCTILAVPLNLVQNAVGSASMLTVVARPRMQPTDPELPRDSVEAE